MGAPPAGISEADWLATPVAVRKLILAQQEEIEQLRAQFTALATELANLRERIGRSSRNSSKPPSNDGPGFKPPERRKGSGRKRRGGQPGHPGAGPVLLPMERVDEVVVHQPDACRRCGMLLQGEDPAPLRHQVIEIPPITPVVIEHRLRHLVGGCGSDQLWPKLSALVGLLGSAFPLSFSKTQALLDQLLGVKISYGTIATIRRALSAALEQPINQTIAFARQQPVVYVVDEVLRAGVETGAPTGNADGGNPDGKRGWQWVMMTAMVTVFMQGLSRSTAAAIDLLGDAFGGIVVSDRFSSYNYFPLGQRQLCWAHVIRDLTAIAERQGASGEIGAELLALQQ
jgi:transposase